MQLPQFDPEWKSWALHNLNEGCDPLSILKALLRQGFPAELLVRELGGAIPEIGPGLDSFSRESETGYDYTASFRLAPRPVSPAMRIQRIENDWVPLFLAPDFLDGRSCDELAALVRDHCRPSTILNAEAGDGAPGASGGTDIPLRHHEASSLLAENPAVRTSSTSDLSRIDHPAVRRVDAAICDSIGIHPGYGEGLQGQLYLKGQEFKPHTDYFEAGSEGQAHYPTTAAAGRAQAQRTWTVLVFLNAVDSGGATHFPMLDREFAPIRGAALFWNNLTSLGLPNPVSLHAGTPVESGEKVILTKWFRDRGKGEPFMAVRRP